MSRLTVEDLPPAMREQARAQLNQPPGPSLVYTKACPLPLYSDQSRAAHSPLQCLQPTPRKYRNEPITVDGRTFDSKWEYQRYTELRNQVAAGLVTDLYAQVPFGLDVWSSAGPVRVGCWVADFTYRREGAMVVEDAKSSATRKNSTYQLKRKMFEAQYGIAITEVERRRRKRKP